MSARFAKFLVTPRGRSDHLLRLGPGFGGTKQIRIQKSFFIFQNQFCRMTIFLKEKMPIFSHFIDQVELSLPEKQ